MEKARKSECSRGKSYCLAHLKGRSSFIRTAFFRKCQISECVDYSALRANIAISRLEHKQVTLYSKEIKSIKRSFAKSVAVEGSQEQFYHTFIQG